jgi:hypothetical protein
MGWIRQAAAGAAGGIVAGAAISALQFATEKTSGTPSDLVKLGRKTSEALGSPYRYNPDRPAPEEQAMAHGGHMLLSAVLGALYPAARRLPGPNGVPGGLLFGAGLYPLLWGALGPALRLTPTPRQEGVPTVVQRLLIHAGFGLVTALVAEPLLPRRDDDEF